MLLISDTAIHLGKTFEKLSNGINAEYLDTIKKEKYSYGKKTGWRKFEEAEIEIIKSIAKTHILTAATALFMQVYKMRRKYGQHGMMKTLAKLSIPPFIKSYSRKTFYWPDSQFANYESVILA